MKPSLIVHGVERTRAGKKHILFTSSNYAEVETELEELWARAEQGDELRIVRVDAKGKKS